jgi:hypothetical protein
VSAVALVAGGVAGYILLDGIAAGLALFAAGLLLLALAIWGWHGRH